MLTCRYFLTQRTCSRFSKQRKPENCYNIRKYIRYLGFGKDEQPWSTVLIPPYTAWSLYLGAAQSQLAREVVSVNVGIKQQPPQASSLKLDYFSAPPPLHFHEKYTTPCTALQFLYTSWKIELHLNTAKVAALCTLHVHFTNWTLWNYFFLFRFRNGVVLTVIKIPSQRNASSALCSTFVPRICMIFSFFALNPQNLWE